jgi:transposase-like protein
MPYTSNSYSDYVFSLSDKDFELLQDAVIARRTKKGFGALTLDELAQACKRSPSCPVCGSDLYIHYGHRSNGRRRYKCKECGSIYTLLSNTIFASSRKPISVWALYIVLMTFNVPLEETEVLCDISHPTAMLW